MSTRLIIMDLDDTIINSHSLKGYRDNRNWKACVRNLSEISLYNEIPHFIEEIRSTAKLAIVTNSVSFYAEAALRHFEIPYDLLVAFHDCPSGMHKPHPFSITKCLQTFSVPPNECLGVGDSSIDATAYANANIAAIGAGWSNVFDPTGAWASIAARPSDILPLT